MTAMQDAIYISTALAMIIFVPWAALAGPALVQGYIMGNPLPAAVLIGRGFHLIAFATIGFIFLILLMGAWIDQ